MSASGKVGKWEFLWKTVPRGHAGSAQVEVREKGSASGQVLGVRWRRDADGIWIELPNGVHGFDIQGEAGDERMSFHVAERAGDAYWQGLSYLHAGEEQAS